MPTHPIIGLLDKGDHKLVLAESCTGGMICASLAQIPGISSRLCGSAVTYRSETKSQWLSIPVSLIEQYTAESAEVTQAMAREVLAKTPEATISAAITGHFGPDAPQEMDGVVFIAVSRRVADKIVQVTCIRRELVQTDRLSRQLEASQLVIKQIQSSLQ